MRKICIFIISSLTLCVVIGGIACIVHQRNASQYIDVTGKKHLDSLQYCLDAELKINKKIIDSLDGALSNFDANYTGTPRDLVLKRHDIEFKISCLDIKNSFLELENSLKIRSLLASQRKAQLFLNKQPLYEYLFTEDEEVVIDSMVKVTLVVN